MLWIAIPAALFHLRTQLLNSYVQVALTTLLCFYLLAMGLNLFPGFHKIELVPSQNIGESTIPFQLSYTLAKPIAGLMVLGIMAQITKTWQEARLVLFSLRGFLNWFVPALLLLVIGYLIRLKIDVKWMPWFGLFMLTNLTFTVIQEQAFFRAFIQQPLQTRFGRRFWILPVSALPFAAVHTAHPGANLPAFYAVLTVAGMLYAWSYFQSLRLESVYS